MSHSKEINKSTETDPEKDLMADLLDKDLDTNVLKMLKKPKGRCREIQEMMHKMEISIKRQKLKTHQTNFEAEK